MVGFSTIDCTIELDANTVCMCVHWEASDNHYLACDLAYSGVELLSSAITNSL